MPLPSVSLEPVIRHCFPVLSSIFSGYHGVIIYYCLWSLIYMLTSRAYIVKFSESMLNIYKGWRVVELL